MSSVRSSSGEAGSRRPIRPWFWFCVFLGVVLVALAAMVWAVVILNGWLHDWGQPVAELGVVGDMFGAANALFSGMAFTGLIVVLVYDMRERERDLSDRMESRRPVLTVRFGNGENDGDVAQAAVSRAVYEVGHGVDLRLEITIPLQSLADVALTPAFELAIVSAGSVVWTEPRKIGLPISSGEKHGMRFVAQFSGDSGRALLTGLITTGTVRLRASAEYDSVSGVSWHTIVEAELRVAPDDEGFARQVLSGSGSVDKHAPGRVATSLKTDVNVDASSWKHGRVGASGA